MSRHAQPARPLPWRPVVAVLAVVAALGLVLGLTACGGTSSPAARPRVTVTVTRTATVTAPPKVIRKTRWRTRTVTVPAGSPPVPSVNGATWSMNIGPCSVVQCVPAGEPGAGPFGSTCGAIVGDRQVCVGGPGPP